MTAGEEFGRSPRLSEAETVARMLRTGAALVAEEGLRIGVDSVSIEEIIEEARVSRAAVYRHWPRREDFFADLMLTLGGRNNPASATLDPGTVEAIAGVALSNPERFTTPQGRHWLLVEMCRQGSQENFDALRRRSDWRMYVALHSALLALPDTEFRSDLKRALAESSQGFIGKMSGLLDTMLGILGYRIRPGLTGLGTTNFAVIGVATVEGSVLMAGANDDVAEARFRMDPFGVGESQPWSHVSLAYTGLAVLCSEPDPDVVWNQARIAGAAAAMEQFGGGSVDRSVG